MDETDSLYGRFNDVSLMTIPTHGMIPAFQLEMMYNIIENIVEARFRDNAFFRIFLRTYVREQIHGDDDLRNFFAFYNSNMYLRSPVDTFDKILDLFESSTLVDFTESRVDDMAFRWARETETNMDREMTDKMLQLSGKRIFWKGMHLGVTPIRALAISCIDNWPPYDVVPLPGQDERESLNLIENMLRMHVDIVKRSAREMIWAARSMFLTMEWNKDPRVNNWQMARFYGKHQTRLERAEYVQSRSPIVAAIRESARNATSRMVEQNSTMRYGGSGFGQEEGPSEDLGGFTFSGAQRRRRFVF
jgi:hypothetical protein